jgi:hypothetical protein
MVLAALLLRLVVRGAGPAPRGDSVATAFLSNGFVPAERRCTRDLLATVAYTQTHTQASLLQRVATAEDALAALALFDEANAAI